MANLSLIEQIERIYRTSEEKGFSNDLFKEFKKDLTALSKYFGLTIQQSYWMSIIFFHILENDSTCSFKDLKQLLELSPVELIKQLKTIDEVVALGFLIKKNQTRRNTKINMPTSVYFNINPEISRAIIYGEPIESKKEVKIETVLDFIEQGNELIAELHETDADNAYLISKYLKLKENLNFGFLDFLKENKISPQSELFLLYVVWSTLSGNTSVDGDDFFKVIFNSRKDRIRYVQSLLNKKDEVIFNDVLEIEEGFFPGDVSYVLTPKTRNALKEENVLIGGGENYNFDLIKPENVTDKKLVLPEKTQIAYNELDHIIREENYEGLINRLEAKKLPKSVNILLYGAPGTGKTEMVYQLAKTNNREVIRVNISDVKSKWFGDSEKMIKRIFSDYREFSKGRKIKPILLFNEADGVIGKRFSHVDTPIAASMNAMQNIILEEMENFEGILIATTNLENNFDSAFERRFLYKVQFFKPGKKEQEALWKVKLNSPEIESDIQKLVADFDLTGAQIENVVRRTEIQAILYNKPVNFEMLKTICTEEEVGFSKNNKMMQIGFQK